MKETRRIDLWVGRSAAIVGVGYVVLASPWQSLVGRGRRRTARAVIGTVVRCPERRRLRGAAIVAATCVAAIAAALFVTIGAIATGSDTWASPLASVASVPY